MPGTAANDESVDWGAVGQQFLRERCNGQGADLQTTFGKVAHRIAQGKAPGEADIEELYSVLDEAEDFVDELAAISPKAQRRPRTGEYLSQDTLREVQDEIDAERGDQ